MAKKKAARKKPPARIKKKIAAPLPGLKALHQEMARLKEQLEETEKQGAPREIWGYIGHEVKNYASMILSAAEEAERLKDTSAVMLALKIAKEASGKLLNLADGLRHYSQMNESKFEFASPVDLLDKTAVLMQPSLERDGVRLVRLFPVKTKVKCDVSQLEQVFINLILNARDALAGRKDKQIRLESQEKDGQLYLKIADNGCGMKKEVRANAFKPFFSTKKNKQNYGLGLSVCRDIIVKHHGGRLRLESTPNIGTTFTLILPL